MASKSSRSFILRFAPCTRLSGFEPSPVSLNFKHLISAFYFDYLRHLFGSGSPDTLFLSVVSFLTHSFTPITFETHLCTIHPTCHSSKRTCSSPILSLARNPFIYSSPNLFFFTCYHLITSVSVLLGLL